MKWMSLLGRFSADGNSVRFCGGCSPSTDGHITDSLLNLLSDEWFGGGTLSADVTFVGQSEGKACEFILHYDPQNQRLLTAGIGRDALAVIREFGTGGPLPLGTLRPMQPASPPQVLGVAGPRDQLCPDRTYRLAVDVAGSFVRVRIDGIVVIATNLPFAVPSGQDGLWCFGQSDILVGNFSVATHKPHAFVVMQFSPPFDSLYSQAIKPVCERVGVEVHRADDVAGPGAIVADIARLISEANIVIAEITPDNANVFFEVGLACAIGKPTILLARRDRQLPFDVSPFRAILYEDSIAGKASVEAHLERFLRAILDT